MSEKITRAKNLIEQNEVIKNEIKTCSILLNKREGDFSEYEYCKNFIEKFENFGE
jgi:hypothetical protein